MSYPAGSYPQAPAAVAPLGPPPAVYLGTELYPSTEAFWRRVGARFLDTTAIVGIVCVFVFSALPLVWVPAGAAYLAAFWWAVYVGGLLVSLLFLVLNLPDGRGYTWTRWLLGLRVVDRDGRPASTWRMVGRNFACLVTNLTFGYGYLKVLWDPQQQALHDQLADTRVVREQDPAYPRHLARIGLTLAAVTAVLFMIALPVTRSAEQRRARQEAAVRAALAAPQTSEEAAAADAHAHEGYLRFQRGDYEGSIAEYTQALEKDPSRADLYGNRANCYLKEDDFDRALVDLDRAIELAPQTAGYYADRGLAYSGKRDHTRALRDYDEAIRLDPNAPLAYGNRAVSNIALRRYGEALRDLDRAVKLAPEEHNFHANRAIVLLDMKRLDEALAESEAALKLKPNDPGYLALRGQVHVQRRELGPGIADLEAGLSLDPHQAIAQYDLGLAYEESGRPADAREAYRKFIALGPADYPAELAAARNRIDALSR